MTRARRLLELGLNDCEIARRTGILRSTVRDWRCDRAAAFGRRERVFCDACDRLGVHWTVASRKNISIARRADVAFLDTFIGPKV